MQHMLKTLFFYFSLTLFSSVVWAQCPTGNVTGNRTISTNCTISNNLTISGNLTLASSATLTINSGVVLTVGGVLQSSYQGGVITINGGGTLNAGGRLFNQVRTSTSFNISNVTITVNNSSATTVENDYRSTLNLSNGASFTVLQGNYYNENESTINLNNSTFTVTSGDFLNDYRAEVNLTNGSDFNLNNGDMQTENESLFLIDASDAYINGDMNNDFRADLIVRNGGTLTVTGDFNNGLQPDGSSANEGSVSVNNGSISVGGNLNNTYGSDITVDGGGSMSVTGNVDNAQAASIDVADGTFSYGGTMTDPHSGVNSSSSDSECTDGCCGSGCAALPVSLVAFEAETTRMGVALQWCTVSEQSNDYFTIEKSLNGKDFKVLAEVKGAGDTNDERSYSYTDLTSNGQKAYYRLSQTDFDGTHVYLKVVVVGSPEESTVRLYPNVIEGDASKLRVEGVTADMSWKLVDLNGNYINCGSFINSKEIDAGYLSKGLYVLQITSSQGFYQTEKLVVR